MSDIKNDVKDSVKEFTQIFVSTVVRESTRKLIQNLSETEKKLLESKTKNMSYAQLEQYFANDPYFKNILGDTIKSVSEISPEKVSGSRMEGVESAYKSDVLKSIYTENLAKTLTWPASNAILVVVVSVTLLAAVIIPIIINTPSTYAYITNGNSSSVSVIDTSTNKVTATMNVGRGPISFGQFIGSLQAQPIFPVADFNSNVTSGYAPLAGQFNDLSQKATSRI